MLKCQTFCFANVEMPVILECVKTFRRSNFWQSKHSGGHFLGNQNLLKVKMLEFKTFLNRNVVIFNIFERWKHLGGSNVEVSNIWVSQMLRCPTFGKSSKSRGKNAKTFGRVKCWDVQHLKKQMLRCPTFGRVKCWKLKQLLGKMLEVKTFFLQNVGS